MATNNYNTLLQGTVTINSAYQNRLVCNVTLHLFVTLLNEFECNSNIQYIFVISIEVYTYRSLGKIRHEKFSLDARYDEN